MNKTEFDSEIKTNLIQLNSKLSFGYDIPGGKTYLNYYSRESFNAFCEEMKKEYKEAYNAYYEGAGSELKERNSKYGLMPPKMASVGSSSRFCYLALRNGAKALGENGRIQFEYGCQIGSVAGMAPQLDAFIEDDLMFIEVKCHEIFDKHKITMKQKYWPLIFGRNNDFGLATTGVRNTEEFDVPLSLFGIEKSSTMFDIKQLLCHLLGVASYSGDGRTKKLIYLFFKPVSESRKEEIESLFSDLKEEIDIIFRSSPIQTFCKNNKIILQAFAEESHIMEDLTSENMFVLHA